jgi:uncharacterized phage protein (TIGR01671 family)
MIEPKFRITLKASSDINGHKKGDTVIIINEIFDRKNGIAFYPIDKEFEIISKDEFTGLFDKNGKEIFEKDAITTKYSKHSEVEFYVKKIDGTFVLVDDYEIPGEFHHLYDNVDFEYIIVNSK